MAYCTTFAVVVAHISFGVIGTTWKWMVYSNCRRSCLAISQIYIY